jgi:predicted PP-loop superfamily ATPase
MKLKDIAAKPKLAEIVLDSEDIVKEYGEALTFWTWDRQPLDTFIKLAGSGGSDYTSMVKVLKTLILDEEGKEVIQGEVMLPTKVLVAAMSKITEQLGN